MRGTPIRPQGREPRDLPRAIWRLGGGLALAAIVLLILAMQWLGVAEVRDWQEQAKPYCLLWRMAVLLALAVFWPELIAWIGRRYRLPPEAVHNALALRWRFVGALLVFDLLIVQNGLGHLIQG